MENKVFIGGLSFETTEDSLRSKLEEYGHVLGIRIVCDFTTGKSKGFAFATYEGEEGAKNAIENLNNEMLDGRRIGVQKAVRRTQNR